MIHNALLNVVQKGVVHLRERSGGILRAVVGRFLGYRPLVQRAMHCVVFLLVCVASVSAQDAYRDSVARAGERSRVFNLDELQRVEFAGCVQTTPKELLGVISSIESELTITRQLTLYFEENLRRNPATPKVIIDRLDGIRQGLINELRYYSAETASDDSLSLLTYLDQNGFHNARVSFTFGYDSSSTKNTLTFFIDEGQRAVVDTIAITGLDGIDQEIASRARSAFGFRRGSAFSESEIESSVRSLIEVLHGNGYYRATYRAPLVGVSDDGTRDTVVVIINPGKRVKIDTIMFNENTMGYPEVSLATRKRQLDIEIGQWYDRRSIEMSKANLLSLGTFEIVLIDTISVDSARSYHCTDSTIGIRVFTRNSKPHDVGMNTIFYQTAVDNFLNLGVGATAQYRNVFGGAQVASVTLQYVLQDVARLSQGQQLETEALASLVLAWPNIGRLFNQRFGIQTSTIYSQRQLVNPFRLESASFGVLAPINLYTHTFLTNVDINLSIERQVPRNFQGTLDQALSDSKTPEDTAYVLSTFNQFLVLDSYLQRNNTFFTGLNAGVTLRGDHRDNPINPRRGTFSSFSIEWGWGAGKYIRGQAFLSSAFPIGDRLTGATKIKLGHIELLEFARGDSLRNNTYVPLERQFFAGGPASIRSYPSRLLHDPRSGQIRDQVAKQEYVLANVIGSGSLLELGFELRYTFARPRGLSDLVASMIERSGFTFFTDIGNAFNRFTTDLYGTAQLRDLYEGSVVAMGIGYRFETPVGPFRVDYATSVYDPLRPTDQWIVGRRGVMNSGNWQLSIGLGHAF
jgi:outer membrane protein assembly factor BamA